MVTAVEAAFVGAGEALRTSGYAGACPIATVALEVSSTSEPLRVACAEVFESWIQGLVDRFQAEGLGAEAARTLAQVFLMLLEGAFLFCRAARSLEAMDAAGTAAVAATRSGLAAATSS